MKKIIDLSKYEWTVCGAWPQSMEKGRSMETGFNLLPEISPVPAKIPGSVQMALRKSGGLPDWNLGLNAHACEWVENRAWLFMTSIPVKDLPKGVKWVLRLDGLDGNGYILVNGKRVGTFDNAFVPYSFALDDMPESSTELRLEVIFEPPPRWLGQICRTSQIKDWKPRFNYTWDWTSRLVQIGIWDGVFLEGAEEASFQDVVCISSYDVKSGLGSLALSGSIQDESPDQKVKVSIVGKDGGKALAEQIVGIKDFTKGIKIREIPVSAWWPNGFGEQPLYRVKIDLLDKKDSVLDAISRTIGFRNIEWQPCKNAPKKADPWICVVNGTPVFLQGVNWTPIKPNFADVTVAECNKILDIYQEMGCTILRVWGGAVLEKESFYDACDERGIMIWQEFPLSSSGIDNWPSEDEKVIREIADIAKSYIQRRHHHPSLLLWCGGNELQGSIDGSKTGSGKPVDDSHPLIKRLKETVNQFDPARRFLPTSSSGPRFCADRENMGKGLHWDIHGPWTVVKDDMAAHQEYWENDDSLFRSEAGTPGASSAEIIMRYAGDAASPFPASLDNPLWRRTSWWFDWPQFKKENGSDPKTLEEYVAWSQKRQATALTIAAKASKKRFPECGGFIVWMGHDCFPCTCNTSIIDFEGNPKPAALALKEIFRKKPGELK